MPEADGTAAGEDAAVDTASGSTKHGPGRVLITVYAILAIGSTARSLFELATKFDQAPVPYLLSTFAAVVYCVITVALVKDTPGWRRGAFVGMVVELVGVHRMLHGMGRDFQMWHRLMQFRQAAAS